MRSGKDVAIGGAHGETKRVADIRDRRIPRFVVADEPREDRETGGVGRGPSVRSPIVRLHIEKRAGAGKPLRVGGVVPDVVELVQILVRAVDDDQMAIGRAPLIDVRRRAALDPMRPRDRLRRKRVERDALTRRVIDAVAFVPILERHRLFRLIAVDDRVRHAVNVDTAR